MKNKLRSVSLVLLGFLMIFLCCGAGYWLWSSLGTVVQQWVLGALALVTGYYVIGIIISLVVLVGLVALVMWAQNQ